MKTTTELKSEAKEVLKGRWKESVMLCLIPLLIRMAITLLLFLLLVIPMITFIKHNPDFFSGNTSYELDFENGIHSFVSGIVSTLFNIGISWTFLDILRGRKKRIRPLMDGLRAFAKPFILGAIGLYLLTFVFSVFWLLLLVIPGIVKSYSYSQVYFIYYDVFEEKGTRPSLLACITKSRNIMNGYKRKLFLLDLSFIGWHILAILSLGIGYLWLIPYIYTTKAVFYENLLKAKII
ncbi:DUF975 family protein [Enterococcus faecalis]|nr:DUF975 family protein [Enterococcus faecalis]HBI1555842.1 DUF975 family protein [Enterococcus faecalis]HBI1558905.1 DUF975 family protein [Enterococcus faecalis]HBI1567798.1 DUF975 family protein [Enterococcus faecalis]